MNKTVKKTWNIITTVLVAAVVLLAVLLVGVRLAGLQVYTILSGSMEPTYPVGSLIYVKKIDPADLQIGDPATFVLNEDLVVATHRVVIQRTSVFTPRATPMRPQTPLRCISTISLASRYSVSLIWDMLQITYKLRRVCT